MAPSGHQNGQRGSERFSIPRFLRKVDNGGDKKMGKRRKTRKVNNVGNSGN